MQTLRFLKLKKLPALFLLICFSLIFFDTSANTEIKTSFSPAVRAAAGRGASFGFNLFARLNQKQNENIFLSPASIAWCLSMVLNGAEGTTKDEMVAALQVKGITVRDLNGAYRDIKNSWATIDPKVEIQVANSIWSRQGIEIRPEFVDINKNFYQSEVRQIDFNDPRALTEINSWVKNKTRGKIDKIIDQISADSVLFLLNAIYFNGKWTKEFDTAKTKQDPFTTGSGSQKVLPMMRQSGTYEYHEQPDFQAIRLPYGSGRLNMYVFLPSKGSNLKTFHASLTSTNWEKWITQFQEAEGQIVLPKFAVKYEVALNEPLKALGMKSAFDPRQANLGAMTSAKTYISNVKHKAFVEVTEEGTEAAAVTSTEIRVVSMPLPLKKFQMIVNRPFFFAIRDNSTGVLLFIGSVADPQS